MLTRKRNVIRARRSTARRSTARRSTASARRSTARRSTARRSTASARRSTARRSTASARRSKLARRRSNTAKRIMRKGGSDNKVVVKSFPNNKKEKFEDEIKKCDYCVIKFYMTTCPHCVDIKKTWEELGKSDQLIKHCNENNVIVGVFEVEVSQYGEIDEKYIGESQGVPHIICVDKEGKKIDTFEEDRTIENFVKFACKKK
jgi:hypothetical protein